MTVYTDPLLWLTLFAGFLVVTGAAGWIADVINRKRKDR